MTGVRLGMLSHTLHADTPCMQTWSGVHRNGTNGFMYDRQPPGESRSRCPCVAVDVGEAKATIGNETVQYPADIEQGKCSVSCLNLLPNGAVESFWDAMRLGPMVFMGRETTLHNM